MDFCLQISINLSVFFWSDVLFLHLCAVFHWSTPVQVSIDPVNDQRGHESFDLQTAPFVELCFLKWNQSHHISNLHNEPNWNLYVASTTLKSNYIKSCCNQSNVQVKDKRCRKVCNMFTRFWPLNARFGWALDSGMLIWFFLICFTCCNNWKKFSLMLYHH